MSGTVERKGTSTGKKAVIVVFIFLVTGVVMDAMNNWHLLHQLLKH